MRDERQDHTLQATALVHEAYARLVGNDEIAWDSRGHFFVAAAEAMRRILIEHARGRERVKRGGGVTRVRLPISVLDLAVDENPEEILSVDEAICRLSEQDARMGDVVRLRFFAGLSEQETAKALGVTDRTVRRDWTLARAWLQRELTREDSFGRDP
jgi:RNA polymerase sigma factor (TIGR02999 family)